MYEHYSQVKIHQVDQEPVDGWTLVHAGYGVAAGITGVPILVTLGVALAWEVVENWKRPDVTFDCFPDWTPEVNINIILDVITAMVGWGLGAAIAACA
jgi:hypothetical protein